MDLCVCVCVCIYVCVCVCGSWNMRPDVFSEDEETFIPLENNMKPLTDVSVTHLTPFWDFKIKKLHYDSPKNVYKPHIYVTKTKKKIFLSSFRQIQTYMLLLLMSL